MKKTLKLNIEGQSLNLDYNQHFANLVQINQSLNQGAKDNFLKQNLTYVDVPEIVGITGACENVDTLFKVGNHQNLPLFFTQTGQLALEQTLQSFPGAWTVIHSGRDEQQEDARHLRQFRLTEEEFDCRLTNMTRETYDEELMFDALLNHIQSTTQAMLTQVLTDHQTLLRKTYHRSTKLLKQASTQPFPRISYEDAIKLLQSNGFPHVQFGDDLVSDQEAKIVEILNSGKQLPVFITRYPKEIKFFNMKVSTKDPHVVLSADLIFPFAGEGTGSAVREHNFSKLEQRLLTSTMYRLHLQRGGQYQDFAWYLNIIKNQGTHPHAGYGIGNERVLQYIFGESDIRHVSVFSLLNHQTGDWDATHYGQAAIIHAPQPKILLSIGRKKNKKLLLPHIKKLVKNDTAILYATQKTHDFLKTQGVNSLLVYKISDISHQPNIADLLSRRVFDLIINIPYRPKIKKGSEFTDGKLIRKGAVDLGIKLITDPEVAIMTIQNLNQKQPI